MPAFDGLPRLPNLGDINEIENRLIPALEAWVIDSPRKDPHEWAIRLNLLTSAHNRLFVLKLDREIMRRLERLERVIAEETTRGIGAVTAHMDGTD